MELLKIENINFRVKLHQIWQKKTETLITPVLLEHKMIQKVNIEQAEPSSDQTKISFIQRLDQFECFSMNGKNNTIVSTSKIIQILDQCGLIRTFRVPKIKRDRTNMSWTRIWTKKRNAHYLSIQLDIQKCTIINHPGLHWDSD